MFSYRLILKRAFNISLRHKYLWFFGFFAAFLVGSGQYNLAFGSVSEDVEGSFLVRFTHILKGGISGENILINFDQAFKADPLSTSVALVFLVMALILLLVVFWLAVVSQIALINNSAAILKKDKKTTIKEGLDAGIVNFWPVLGINLFGKGLTYFLVAFISLPLLFAASYGGASIGFLYIFLFIVFLPLALIISFMMQYAAAYVILKKEKFVDAIIKSWNLFVQNWLISLEMAFILLLVQLLVMLAAFLIFLVVAIPYIFFSQILAMIFATVLPSFVLFNLLIALGMIMMIFFVVLVGASLIVFNISAWTDTFLELDSRKKTLSKLIRLFAK